MRKRVKHRKRCKIVKSVTPSGVRFYYLAPLPVLDPIYLSCVTDKTFIFPLSPTRLLSFLCHRQYFYLSSVSDKIYIFPVSPTRLLSFLCHRQDCYLSCHRQDFYLSCHRQDCYLSSVTDKTFIFPLSPTRL